MTLATLGAYIAVTFLFAISPGPAVLLCIAHGLKNGWPGVWRAAAGVQTANVIYCTLSAVGLGAILMTSEAAFHAVKWAGAAYLIWLGARGIWRAGRAAPAVDPRRVPVLARPFQQGLITQLANPKSVLFWGAFMPQFVNVHAPLAMQYLVLAVVAIVIDYVCMAGYGALAARGRTLTRSPRAIAWRERLAGGALVAVGASLAVIRRAA